MLINSTNSVAALLSQLNITFPLLLAPMAGGISTPLLAASVSNQGCLGSLAGGYLSPEQLEKQIQETQKLTKQPFNVNLFIPGTPTIDRRAIIQMQKKLNRFRVELGIPEQDSFDFPPNHFNQQMDVILAHRVPVFSFTFGLLDAHYKQALKANNTVMMGTATNLLEAQALKEAGCDIVIAQGQEAGGHRGTFIGNPARSLMGCFPLTQQLLAEIALPVVAAGGIMDGQGLNAVLALGAAAGVVGSAFLICPESGASEAYKTMIASSVGEDTVLTQAFSGKLARGIDNAFIEAFQCDSAIPDYPLQHYLTTDIRKSAAQHGKPDYLSLWAGQGIGLVKDRDSTAQMIIERFKSACKLY